MTGKDLEEAGEEGALRWKGSLQRRGRAAPMERGVVALFSGGGGGCRVVEGSEGAAAAAFGAGAFGWMVCLRILLGFGCFVAWLGWECGVVVVLCAGREKEEETGGKAKLSMEGIARSTDPS